MPSIVRGQFGTTGMAGLPQECGLCDSYWFTLVVTQVVSQSQVRHVPGQICSPPMEQASNPIRKQLVTLRVCCAIVPMGISCQMVSDVVWRIMIINDPIPPAACIASPCTVTLVSRNLHSVVSVCPVSRAHVFCSRVFLV